MFMFNYILTVNKILFLYKYLFKFYTYFINVPRGTLIRKFLFVLFDRFYLCYTCFVQQ